MTTARGEPLSLSVPARAGLPAAAAGEPGAAAGLPVSCSSTKYATQPPHFISCEGRHRGWGKAEAGEKG